MAHISFCGWETANDDQALTTPTGTYSIQNTIVDRGQWALRINPITTAVAYWPLGTYAADGTPVAYSNSDVWIRFRFRYATKPASANEELVGSYGTSANNKLAIRLESTGALSLYARNSSFLGTSSTILSADTWYLLELRCGTSTSVGPYELKINGVSELSGTTNLTSINNGQIRFGKTVDRNGNSVDFYYDNAAIDDTGFPADGVCKIILPDSNGSTAQWTAGTNSSNHLEVDEVAPDDDTTYVKNSGASPGQIHLFGYKSLSESSIVAQNINAVMGYARIREDTSVTSATKLRLRSASTNSDTSTFDHTTSYLGRCHLRTTDPATSAAWTHSALDALEFGVVEDNSVAMRCTAAYIMVDYSEADVAALAWQKNTNPLRTPTRRPTVPYTLPCHPWVPYVSRAFTTAAAGNYSATATWTQGRVPSDMDTATINHAVTQDIHRFIGDHGGSTTVGLTIGSAGSLSVNDNIQLTARCAIDHSGGTMTLGAGSVLEYDSTVAAAPSSTNYRHRLNTAHSQNSMLICNGTAGNRAVVRSNAGGGNGRITDGGFIKGGQVDAEYTDFTRLGTASVNAFEFWGSSGATFSLQNCRFTSTGQMDGTISFAADSNFTLLNCTFVSSLDADYQGSIGSTNAITSGTRLIKGCVFDKAWQFFPPTDFTIGGPNDGDGNYFHDGWELTDGAWALFQGNLVRTSDAGSLSIAAHISDCYWLKDGALSNPHGIQVLTYARSMTIDGVLFEFTGTNNEGDSIVLGSPGSAATATIQNCIVLPNAGGETTGSLFSALGNANITIICNHNTAFLGTNGGGVVSETYAGHAGMVSSFRSNLLWDTTARGFKLWDSGTDNSVTDLVTSANANFNGGHNFATGDVNGYNNLEFSSGTPGANDVTGDPQFVDRERDLARWDLFNGGAGTVANALTKLQAKNTVSEDSTYTIYRLITFVREGFRPQNSSYKNAGHDSTTIGAREIIWLPCDRGSMQNWPMRHKVEVVDY